MTGKDVVAQEVAEVQIPAGNPSLWSRSVLQVLHLLLQWRLPLRTELQTLIEGLIKAEMKGPQPFSRVEYERSGAARGATCI